ncbi:MAG: HD domain-containing protein [Candidatus Sungbacteria bacterium]|uniref:HD domain-containing protein n=1 Tax=Candidatus Sungiibacteriota bacterium TaxID=2750080 RepID=A0A933DRX9_9BACT|nr:HD domain-containing protein [Candidatus Sungbacteria bacterium]
MKVEIPREVREVVRVLARAGFEAYAVGGCVRDLLMGRKPDDWDVTTNAQPERIRELFPESFYENKFFTVTVKTGAEDPTLREIEVTTFRAEGKYRDKRHPEEVRPAKTLAEDLSRRDFTINAVALQVEGQTAKDEGAKIIDPFSGKNDIAKKLIRAVGTAEERFEEDALRMLRAVRLAAILGFAIEPETEAAIQKNAVWIQAVSKERIRDEFSKIIMSTETPPRERAKDFSVPTDNPVTEHNISIESLERIGASNAWIGMETLHRLGLLKYVVPELEEGIGCTQNKHHVYTVWEHNMRSLDYAAKNRWPLAVRIGALFHDIAKPRSKVGEGPDSTFYGHDVLGAKLTHQILSRLRYPEVFVERVSRLVRWHLFRYDYEVDEVQTTDSSIRRLIRNIGVENIEDLVRVRMCDRIGSGVPKAVPYRLRHFQFRVEKVLREHEAVKVTMLQANGENVMRILEIPPGPKVGHVLNALLEEVLDDPKKNSREYLEPRIKELGTLSDEELVALRERAEARVELLEDQREQEIKKKYYVK